MHELNQIVRIVRKNRKLIERKWSEYYRTEYEISGGGTGLHWEKLDEDISVKFLLMGVFDRTSYAKRRAELKEAA